jgi:ABC-type Fe3+-hydroxamate transport system substrate-binding protein
MKYKDQMNRRISLEKIPERIISMVPSQTELLVDLGLADRIVGVTKFCVHPVGFKLGRTIIGGTKNFKFDKIDALKPDLIIGNKEENYKEGIEFLIKKYPVWMSDIYNLEDALEMMRLIGQITGKQNPVQEITNAIEAGFQEGFSYKGTAVYLIWQDPLIAAGKHTFIDDMLQRAGFINLVIKERYPEISREEIILLNPDFILLSSEPYPFREKHVEEYQEFFPQAAIKLVDGEMFSWYGSRLLKALEYFKSL